MTTVETGLLATAWTVMPDKPFRGSYRSKPGTSPALSQLKVISHSVSYTCEPLIVQVDWNK